MTENVVQCQWDLILNYYISDMMPFKIKNIIILTDAFLGGDFDLNTVYNPCMRFM